MTPRAALVAGAALVGALIVAAAAASQRMAFPGTNGKVAYDDDSGIWVVRPDGRGRRLLLAPQAGYRSPGGAPAWSPAGDRLLFTASLGGSLQLWLVNPDGSGTYRLTGPRSILDEWTQSHSPSWSPDGLRIVFVSDAEEGRPANLFIADVDGTRARRLAETRFGVEHHQPVWSPAGDRIAFVRLNQLTDRTNLYLVNPDGTGLKPITNSGRDGAPDWSPDGSKLVFVRVEGSGASQHGSLYVINSDGSGLSRLTKPKGSDIDPAWSPDGRRIVFARGRRPAVHSSDRGGLFDLYVINVDGTGLRRLTSTKGSEGSPDWQPLP